VTPQAKDDLRTNQSAVNFWMTIEDVTKRDDVREQFFGLLGV
jgi:hypothetical protein